MSEHKFSDGIRDSIPIILGYLSVSFGFGVYAVGKGLNTLTAVMISLTNVTSAGQIAGVDVIVACGTLIELIVTEFIINIRYALMSISLTQKLDSSFTTAARALIGFGITDEVFGVAHSKEGLLNKSYMVGLIAGPVLGWVLGTLLGGLAGSIMPQVVRSAMGIMLYAMFIALVLPPSAKNKPLAFCVLLAAAVSCVIRFVPVFSFITPGFAVVLCALAASIPAAILWPVEEEAEHA